MSGSVRLASLILLLVSFGGGSLGHVLRLSNSEDGGEGPILVELLLRVGMDRGSPNIEASNCGQICTNEMKEKNLEIKRLKSVIQHLLEHCNSSSDEVTNYNSSNCPTPEMATSVEFPPQCCSFPFTLDGQLHYRCVPRFFGLFGCFIQNRIWVSCAEPAEFIARNQTVTLTIPLVARFTSTSVHNWIVWQQRVKRAPFNRSWEEFKVGFGSPDGNFWLGLEKVHKMTNSAPYKLRMEFMIQNGSWYSAEYDTFRVGSESENYKIDVGGYSGDLWDVMNISSHVHNQMYFTTCDHDNDRNSDNCATTYGGGWWYNNCHNFNLHGTYGAVGFAVRSSIDSWLHFAASRMMLKRK